MRNRGVPALFAGVVLLLAACTPPTTALPVPAPPIARASASPRALLARIDGRYDAVRTFRAIAELRSVSPRGREQVREILAVERPSRLRIEMLTAFGIGMLVATNGTRVDAYHHGDREHFRGSASVENMSRFTRLPLPLDDLVDLLLGLPPRRVPREPQLLELEPAARRWRLHTSVGEGGIQILWFDEESQLPVRAEEYDTRGTLLYSAAFRDYGEIDGLSFSREIEIRLPGREISAEMQYSEISLNEPVSADLFSFDPPAGVPTIDLDAVEQTRR